MQASGNRRTFLTTLKSLGFVRFFADNLVLVWLIRGLSVRAAFSFTRTRRWVP
jgi:hypothetical protein